MLGPPMGSRPHGRIAIITVLLVTACAFPALASGRTVEVNGAPFWHDKVINVGGLGWGTAYGVCPAGPIEISSGPSEFSSLTVIGTVPSTSVIPISGGFATDVRLLDRRRAGSATIRLTQEERDYSLRGGCGPPHTTQVERRIDTTRPPPDAPCTHVTDCAAPEPHLTISRSPGGLPENASLPPPTPVCPLEGCSRTDPESLYGFSPGDALWLQGSGFPGTFYTFREGCTRFGSGNAITFAMIDHSGTGFPLGTGDRGESGSSWNLDDGGFFQQPARVVLPARGLAYGRAVITAVRTGYAGDSVCGQVAAAPFAINRAQPTVTLLTTAVPGSRVVVQGANWGTNACDAKVELVESVGNNERVLGKASPGDLGAFSADVAVKSLSGSGELGISARQASGLELADERGRPAKSKCVDKPRTTHEFESDPAEVAPPIVPPPTVPPPTDPPPTPVPTVAVGFSNPSNLHVTGTQWDPAACPGGIQPVQIADTDPRLATPLSLGSAIPDSAGDIVADLAPQAAKAGDAITATQTHCDGSSSTASTTIG
jgi:hypothetical protein